MDVRSLKHYNLRDDNSDNRISVEHGHGEKWVTLIQSSRPTGVETRITVGLTALREMLQLIEEDSKP